MNKVLVVDDDGSVRCTFSELLQVSGFSTIEAPDGVTAIDVFKRDRPHSVLLDYSMPKMDGLETMAELKKIDPGVPIIMITGTGNISIAVEAIKAGAYDFITKPCTPDALILTINRAIEKHGLECELSKLNTTVSASMEYMLGSSESVKKIVSQITQVASSDFSIIIQGETGSGKSIVAALIHSLSKRHKRPFVTVDIGAIAETLVESELFGHGKGAFTGADKNTRGYFEMANNGTVFLDELQNMTLGMQSKLLGAVEQGKICPVGKTEPVDIDIRIISATNADLRELVKEKKFREDLFFRLSEFVIKLPPLRERIDDIPSFATRFCIEACSELNRPVVELSEEVINLLVRHDWPGNVRELKNVIRRAVLLCEGKTMLPEHVDFLTDGSFEYGEHAPGLTLREISSTAAGEAEKAAIKRVLELTKGNKSRAASILHVNYKTLLSKIKQYSID